MYQKDYNYHYSVANALASEARDFEEFRGWQFFPTPCGFSSPHKGGGAGMGQAFSAAPQGGAGMGLDFLDPPHPAPPLLIPASLRVTKGYNCKFFIL